MKAQAHIARVGIEGALMALSPLPLLLPYLVTGPSPNLWQVIIALLAAVL